MGSSKIRDKNKGQEGQKGSVKVKEVLVPDMEDISQISESSVEIFRAVFDASDLTSQVDSVKNIVKTVTSDQYQIVSIVLVQWYFNSTNNFRKVISNSLNQVKDEEWRSLLSEQISLHVSKMIDEESTDATDVVRKLLSTFDNFKLGADGVLANSEAVTRFLLNTLESQMESVCEEDISPVDKARMSDEVSDTVRVMVNMVKNSLDDESEVLKSVSDLVYRIMSQEELAMELRGNCGHILVMIMKSENSSELINNISELATTGETKDAKFRLDQPGPTLALLHGVISSAGKDFFINHPSVLSHLLQCYLSIARDRNESPCILGCSKGLLNWSAKFLDVSKESKECCLLEKKKELFEYVWNSLDQAIDSVKHNTKNLVKNIISGLVISGHESVVDQFLSDTLSLPLHSKASLMSLSCLVQTFDITRIFSVYPNIVSENIALMQHETALANIITDLCR